MDRHSAALQSPMRAGRVEESYVSEVRKLVRPTAAPSILATLGAHAGAVVLFSVTQGILAAAGSRLGARLRRT